MTRSDHPRDDARGHTCYDITDPWLGPKGRRISNTPPWIARGNVPRQTYQNGLKTTRDTLRSGFAFIGRATTTPGTGPNKPNRTDRKRN